MSIFDWGDQTKKAGEGAALLTNSLDKLFTSDDEKLSRAEAIARLEAKPLEIMGKVLVIDAQSKNIFQAGWRPFIGWVAGLSLALYFIPQFGVGAYMFVNEYAVAGKIPTEYPVKPDALIELVIALLGLGTLRTLDKLGGVSK